MSTPSRGGFAAAGRFAGEGGLNGRASPHPTHRPIGLQRSDSQGESLQLVKKGFDKLVDGEASSPATATLTSLR